MVERKIAYLSVPPMRRCRNGILEIDLGAECGLDKLVPGEKYRILSLTNGLGIASDRYGVVTYHGIDEVGQIRFSDQKSRERVLLAEALRSLIEEGTLHIVPTGRTKRRLAQLISRPR